MRLTLPIAIGALLAASCSTLKAPDVPACQGPRRPANPHGSVLAPSAAPSVAAPTPDLGAGPGCGSPRP